jgi:hypothetical protein
MRVVLSSAAILAAIVLIRKGERASEHRVAAPASKKAASLKQCA